MKKLFLFSILLIASFSACEKNKIPTINFEVKNFDGSSDYVQINIDMSNFNPKKVRAFGYSVDSVAEHPMERNQKFSYYFEGAGIQSLDFYCGNLVSGKVYYARTFVAMHSGELYRSEAKPFFVPLNCGVGNNFFYYVNYNTGSIISSGSTSAINLLSSNATSRTYQFTHNTNVFNIVFPGMPENKPYTTTTDENALGSSKVVITRANSGVKVNAGAALSVEIGSAGQFRVKMCACKLQDSSLGTTNRSMKFNVFGYL